MINVHWMCREKLIELLYMDKIYANDLFKEREHDDGFCKLSSVGDLVFAIKNKNVWVKNIEEI